MDLNDKIVIYRTADGQTAADIRMDGDTVWLSQAQMAELFQKDRTVIGRHISNIYKEHELERETTCANFAHTKNYGRREGFTQTKNIVLYNLDVIISVGYREIQKFSTFVAYEMKFESEKPHHGIFSSLYCSFECFMDMDSLVFTYP